MYFISFLLQQIRKEVLDYPKKESKKIMNFKKIVTVIVASFILCLAFQLPCEATATTNAITKEERHYTDSELRYMTSIIYCEARGESYAGQKAVGIVVMNRLRSDDFPDTVKDVIYQKGQFSPVRNGSLSKALKKYDQQKANGKMKGSMKSCMNAAKAALKGSTTVTVKGKTKEMKNYHFFSRYIRNAKFTLGAHQFK